MDLRIAAFDARQKFLIVVDLEARVQPPLHQDSGAAQSQRLVDLPVDRLERLDVTFRRAQGPVEGTECAILSTEISIVDVTVDYISHDLFGMQPPAQRVRLHPHAQQVVGAKHLESLGIGQCHVRSTGRGPRGMNPPVREPALKRNTSPSQPE